MYKTALDEIWDVLKSVMWRIFFVGVAFSAAVGGIVWWIFK